MNSYDHRHHLQFTDGSVGQVNVGTLGLRVAIARIEALGVDPIAGVIH